MGAGQSVHEGKAPKKGLHVLRVAPGSPASQSDLEPFFDFIVGYEDVRHPEMSANIEAVDFERVVEEHEGQRLDLLVWSSKGQSVRRVSVFPSRQWSQSSTTGLDNKGASQSSSQPSLLGLSMRVCEPEFSLDNVWHVLDILENSPSESAGLVPYGDWIVGWSGGVLASEGDFYDLVEAHEDKPLRVYVYSFDFNTLREVVLVPNRQWGGEGLLGCVFGYGLLHRIPAVRDTISDDQDLDEAEMFVPADANGIHGPPVSVTSALSVRRSNSNSHIATPGLTAEAEDADTTLNSHYLDPPIHSSTTPSPRSVAA